MIEDLSGDGIGDLLVENGGDVLAEPFDTNRPPGYLLIIDAANGSVLHKAEMPDGKEIYMSAIANDINGDSYPEGILSVNFFLPNAAGQKNIHNSLLAYDFKNRGKFALAPPQVGSNVESTPWVEDMDNNGLMDIVYVQMITPDHVYTYYGIRVIRLESEVKSEKVFWGAYMDTRGTGVEGQ